MADGQFWRDALAKRDRIPNGIILDEMPILEGIFQDAREGLLGFFADPATNKKDLVSTAEMFKQNPDGVPSTRPQICTFLIYSRVFLAAERMLESVNETEDPAKYAFMFDMANGFQYAFGALLLGEYEIVEGHDTAVVKTMDYLKGERLFSNPIVEADTYMGLDKLLPSLADRLKEDASGFSLLDFMVRAAEKTSPDPSRKFFVESVRLAGDIYKKLYPDSAVLMNA